ncbi:MAG TPA: hypothetical protein VHF06_08905 [Pseudonocardiaceae bacterium]|jgi:hypothetical protein|nr:hypothetical protein [Pseudonocardiaceae bacterium]
MTGRALPDRADVLAMLAGYGDRAPADVGEELGSLELTWLVAQVEQRYAVYLDLTDDAFTGMSTVTGAVDVLRTAITEAGHG